MGVHGEFGVEWPLVCCPSAVTNPPGVEKGRGCGGCTYAPECGVVGHDGVIGGPVGN